MTTTETSPQPQPAPQPANESLNLTAGGDVTAGGNIVSGDLVTVNNTVTVALSGDLLAQLEQIKALSTELTKATSKGAPPVPAPAPVKPAEALKSVDTALELLQRSGAPAQELQAGGLQISRVELLLKKAILLEAEAEEILFDAFLQAGNRTNEAGERLLPENYDPGPHAAKLREAETLLREANQLDPANTEVLARLALVVIEISPDNLSASLKFLNRVQQLISTPKDAAEAFRLAQAKYFLAINQEPLNEAMLHEARAMFAELGRLEWVGYVDADLAAVSAAAFDPRGAWVIEVNDAARTVIEVELLDEGQCRGQRTTQSKSKSKAAAAKPFVGEWGFDPERHILALEGRFEKGRPFTLAVQLQSEDENGIHAVDEQEVEYRLNRA